MAEKLDAERIIDLLDIVHKTINLPTLAPLNGAAMAELAGIVKDLQEAEEKPKTAERRYG